MPEIGDEEVLRVHAFVRCCCGEAHELRLDRERPDYWCGDEIHRLCDGDPYIVYTEPHPFWRTSDA